MNSISMQNDEFVQALNDLKKERDGLIASCETLEKRSLRMEDEARSLREELETERRKNVKDEELKAREDKLEKMQVELESREKRVAELEGKLELLDTELHSKERWLDKEAEEYRNAKAKLEEERKKNEEFEIRLKKREEEINELKRELKEDFQKILDKNEEIRKKDEQIERLTKEYEELKGKKFEESEIMKAKHDIETTRQALEEKKTRLGEWEKELEIRERWLDREAEELKKLRMSLSADSVQPVAVKQSEEQVVQAKVVETKVDSVKEEVQNEQPTIVEMQRNAEQISNQTENQPEQNVVEQPAHPEKQEGDGLRYLQPEPQPERRDEQETEIEMHRYPTTSPIREEDDEGQEARDPRLAGTLIKRKVMKVVKAKKPIKTFVQR
jgi:chromosome segregation ATPase